MAAGEREQVRHLLVLEDTAGRRPILLEAATYSIGRDPTNSIVLHSKMVSRQHGLLLRVTSPESNSYLFRLIDGDLQGKRSTNGILVNGQRTIAHDLRSGDMIVFGGDVRARYLTLTNLTNEEFSDFCQSTDVLGFLSKTTNPFATLVPHDQANIEEFSEAALVRLASYPELTPTPILEVDLEGTVTYLNPAAVMQFGDLQQRKLSHPLLIGLPELACYMQQTQEKVHVREVEYQQRIYEQSIHYIYESELIRSYVMDVTDRKRAEEQLRNQARREAIINRIIQAMRTTMVAAEVLQITADLLLEVLGSSLCLITQSTVDSSTYAARAHLNPPPSPLVALNRAVIATYEPALITGEQIMLITGSGEIPDRLQEQITHCNVNALVVTPLIYLGQLLGHITLLEVDSEAIERTSIFWGDGQMLQQTLPNGWTLDDLSLVKTIADQCALAIHQAQLYQRVQELNADLERQVRARTAELEQKMKELERLNALKDDFLSTVSHELRTPMANMKMAIHMLKHTPMDERQQRYLNILSEAIINRIIQAMRTTMVAAEVLQITADLLLEVLGSSLCLITQSTVDSSTYAARAHLNPPPSPLVALNRAVIATYEPALITGEQIMLITGSGEIPDRLQEQITHCNVNALVVTPLIYLGQLLGHITLLEVDSEAIERTSIFWGDGQMLQQTLPNGWTLDDLSLVKTIADQCALAIHQAQLYQRVQELNADLERQVRARTAELEQKMKELERLNALKDDFLSTVSHELRTPMANMKMAIHMLKHTPMDERQQRYLNILSNECARETELINDLLDLQRLEAGNSQIQQELIDLNTWLPLILEPFHNRMQQRQQCLRIVQPASLPPLLSNRHALERILAELLNNAYKYSPAGGQITLSLLLLEGDRLQIQVSNPSEIPSSELPRIFEKFYRIPNADPWQQGGTGLGLALTQKLVQQLRGEVSVTSTAGYTTFTLIFPIAKTAES
ncbi:histidine kinase dimerization/phospho-acceptor domain-containing protein [Parathermosynechococcus lividus]|uniref:histidine kinase dimerization/phospho-acceptor domain-containing protein n=1 Tax=Parathermosynechococcus lividus TaxID=33070 RepID=UPI000C187D1C|nr:histidine kinase dimerization/phospho-acceptor domain-containing protein [Thermostichus lividus]